MLWQQWRQAEVEAELRETPGADSLRQGWEQVTRPLRRSSHMKQPRLPWPVRILSTAASLGFHFVSPLLLELVSESSDQATSLYVRIPVCGHAISVSVGC